ncbi:MAG: T9SS type A sorting domain-containing protein [Bacteroidetes bacterium]|nr:T9SS type A sorting domain-containing protein [Bacteroidota bacterium]
MTKSIFIALLLVCSVKVINAQTVMQLNGLDCNGVSHDLMSDLDSGKAVILHFFMPNCGSCPPPAQKIQKMANNLLKTYPGMVRAYVMPFNNSTTCATTSSWVSTNGLSLYVPYDSGAMQVANYGWGMPTVVLLGGKNHRIMFSTLSFSTSDTIMMRDSMIALFTKKADTVKTSAIFSVNNANINALNIYPNPAVNAISLNFNSNESGNLVISLTTLNGAVVKSYSEEKISSGFYSKSMNLNGITKGNYLLNGTLNNKNFTKQVIIE